MSNVLVIAELADGHVRKSTHSALTFAREVTKAGGSFSILVLGANAKAAAAALTGFGAAKVLVTEEPSIAHPIAERLAPTVAAVATESIADTSSS